jgi:REP element-mobilizing transposase RayT
VPRERHRRKRIRVDQAVYAQPGTVALLTTCTASRRHVFAQPDHADLLTAEIRRLHGEDWRVLGFSVMPDHVHLLVLNLKGSLIEFMRMLKGRTARRLRGSTTDSLWQRSFHDHLLRRNEDINGTLLYLLENPVRAGLVEEWTQYPWCGSFQWPGIDPEFFAVRPENVLWNEIFGPAQETEDS